jgi:predicted DNA-binding protein (MmcQ/YjbR family)
VALSLDSIRSYCLNKKGTITEEFPFDDTTLVIKVHGKAFLLASIVNSPVRINLKCEPWRARELRERYESVLPGYHMNKKHWNTVVLDGSIPTNEVLAMIDHSYEQVVKGLKSTLRQKLGNNK